ncbi:hypothetical protein GCM10018775_88750 [Streptomyces umbrinus]|nr:hypothetical protein GCM10018775_88750 [Streptomyces umbrinus]
MDGDPSTARLFFELFSLPRRPRHGLTAITCVTAGTADASLLPARHRTDRCPGKLSYGRQAESEEKIRTEGAVAIERAVGKVLNS